MTHYLVTASGVSDPAHTTLTGGNTNGLHVLYSQGPFSIVGQCLATSSSDVNALTYIVSSEPHGANGSLAASFPALEIPNQNTTFFNSVTGPVELVAGADDSSPSGSTVTGTSSGDFEGNDNSNDNAFNALSSDLKTSVDGVVANGVNLGGPPATDCVFEGTINHS